MKFPNIVKKCATEPAEVEPTSVQTLKQLVVWCLNYSATKCLPPPLKKSLIHKTDILGIIIKIVTLKMIKL